MKKKILSGLLILCMSMGVCACQKGEIKDETSSDASVVVENKSDTTGAEETDAGEVDVEEANVDEVDYGISNNWQDLEFLLNNEKYTLGEPIQKFYDKGWETPGYNIEDTDEDKDDFELLHPDYWVKSNVFINRDDNSSVLNCSTRYFSMEILLRGEPYGSYANVVLSKGITWGSTVDEILAAYGEPYYTSEEFDSNGYLILSYASEELDKLLELEIHEEFGLGEIEIAQGSCVVYDY